MIAPIQKTPLWGRHVQLGARMVEFAGWAMPLQYQGILAEHEKTRTGATVFDTCHMGRFELRGPRALEGLSRLLSTDVRAMMPGQCRYGFLLREDGGILDDTITYCFDPGRWLLVVNAGTRARDRAWIQARLPAGAELSDVSGRLAKLDVQGPLSCERLCAALGLDVGPLGYFRFRAFDHAGGEAFVSCTGYTGEKGVELYVDAAQAGAVWDRLLAVGIAPAGLGARDTLRLEAGLPLYGHELSEDVTPVEAGLDRFAAKHEDFIGRDALVRRRAEGPRVRLTGLRITGRQAARAGHALMTAGGEEIGRVTSGSFSPTLQCAIALAYIRAECASPGTRVQVDTGRNRLEAELVTPPFYRPDSTRKTP